MIELLTNIPLSNLPKTRINQLREKKFNNKLFDSYKTVKIVTRKNFPKRYKKKKLPL